MACLSEDVLAKIFVLLDVPEVVCCAAVCRHWRDAQLLESDTLWLQLSRRFGWKLSDRSDPDEDARSWFLRAAKAHRRVSQARHQHIVLEGDGAAVAAHAIKPTQVFDWRAGKTVQVNQGLVVCVRSAPSCEVEVFDTLSGRKRVLDAVHGIEYSAVACSDEHVVLAETRPNSDGKLRLSVLDVASNRVWHTQPGHTSTITVVRLFSETQRAVSVSYDGTLRVWNLATGRQLHVLDARDANDDAGLSPEDERAAHAAASPTAHRMWSVAATPQCDLLATSCRVRVADDARCRVILVQAVGTAHSTLLHRLTGHSDTVMDLRFDEKRPEQVLFSCSYDHSVRMWDLSTGTCVRTFSGHRSIVFCLAVSEFVVVSGDRDGMVKIFDRHSGNCVRTLSQHSHDVKSVELLPDHQGIVSASYDGSAIVNRFVAPPSNDTAQQSKIGSAFNTVQSLWQGFRL